MATAVETRINTDIDVAQSLEQFLADVFDDSDLEEIAVLESGHEVVLCELEMEGMRYKLTCQPYPNKKVSHISLSPREQEVVRLVMKGLSTRGIAKVLEISPWTVTTHLRRVFSKLSVNSRAEMVAFVLNEKML